VQAFILLSADGKRHLVPQADGAVTVDGLGVVDPAKLESRVGSVAKIAGKPFLVLLPSVRDRMETAARKAQTIGAKDAAAILLNCDVNAGDVVIEAGAGSGALTMLLAQAVFFRLVDDGTLVRIKDDLYLHREHVERAKGMLLTHLKAHGSIGVPTFKDLLGVSRKYAIPFLEYFDQVRITRRHGDERLPYR